MTLSVRALDHLVLTVADMDRTIGFYTDVLGMAHAPFTAGDGSVRHALGFGDQKINLHQAGAEFEPKARVATPGSADLCFLTDGAMADWLEHLSEKGVVVEQGPVPRTGATGPILSVYMRDPDGNLIEVSLPDA